MISNFISTKENLASENINDNFILIIQEQLQIILTQMTESNRKNEQTGEWR